MTCSIGSRCPTCARTDREYKLGIERGHHGLCPDLWHGDKHLRAAARINQTPSAFDLAVMKERDELRAEVERLRRLIPGVAQAAPNRVAGKCIHGVALADECFTCAEDYGDDNRATTVERSSAGTVEAIAKWLHDETAHPESYPDYTWPETDRDDGRREGGWVKIVPQHAQAYFRDIARRLVTQFPMLNEPQTARGPSEPLQCLRCGTIDAFGPVSKKDTTNG